MAMASGVPAVAGDAGSPPEVLGDAGLFFPAGDAAALARVLASAAALTPEERLAIAERGRGRAARFSPDAAAEQMLRVYDRALGRRTGSSEVGVPLDQRARGDVRLPSRDRGSVSPSPSTRRTLPHTVR
jgi:hypothetical protein